MKIKSKKNSNKPPHELDRVPSRIRITCEDGGGIRLEAAAETEDGKPKLRRFGLKRDGLKRDTHTSFGDFSSNSNRDASSERDVRKIEGGKIEEIEGDTRMNTRLKVRQIEGDAHHRRRTGRVWNGDE